MITAGFFSQQHCRGLAQPLHLCVNLVLDSWFTMLDIVLFYFFHPISILSTSQLFYRLFFLAHASRDLASSSDCLI